MSNNIINSIGISGGMDLRNGVDASGRPYTVCLLSIILFPIYFWVDDKLINYQRGYLRHKKIGIFIDLNKSNRLRVSLIEITFM